MCPPCSTLTGSLLQYVHLLRPLLEEVMCDFTCRRVASAAERSHVYVREKNLKRGERRRAHLRRPRIWSSAIFFLTLAHIRTSTTRCTVPTLLPRTVPTSFSIPIRAHLAITSPPPHRNQFRLLLHTVMACWPREMESFQVLCYNLPPSRLPSISPSPSLVAAPSLLLNISSTRLVYQQGS